MPLLDQPDTSIYGQTKLFTHLTGPGQIASGPQDRGPTAAQQRFQADQQEQQQIQQLAAQYGDDYDGLVKAVSQINPERGLKMGSTLEQYRQDSAKTDVENSKRSIGMIDLGRRMLQMSIDDPASYPTVAKMIAAAAPQLAPHLPAPDDPELSDKLTALVQKADDTKNYMGYRAEAGQLYFDGKKTEGALTLLAGSKDPAQWTESAKIVKRGGLGDLLGVVTTPEQAQAMLEQQKVAKPESAAKVGSFEDYVTRTYGANPTPAQILAARKAYGQADDRPRVSVSVAGQQGPVQTDPAIMARIAGLTPEALDQSAIRYHEDGTLPSRYSQVAKQQIQNRAGQMFPGSNIAANVGQYGADKASLKTVQGTLDTIQSFHPAALANLKQFDDLFKQIPDTGSPFFNTPIRMLDDKVFGSTKVAAARTALGVATREIARITSNPSLKGQLTDSARQEVEGWVPANATLAQAHEVMRVLTNDLENVERGQRDQLKRIQYRIAHPGQDVPEQPTGAPQAAPQATGGGTVRMRAPNGQMKDVPADRVDFYKSKGAVVVK